MDEIEILKERINKKLENLKQWTDEFGITWVEVNGQKFPKNQFIQACINLERIEYEKEQFNFLKF